NPMTVDYAPDAPPPPVAQPREPRGGYLASEELSNRDARGRAGEINRAEEQSVKVDETRAGVEAQPFQAVYTIAGRVAVPATGEMKRVQIDDMALDPALTVRTVPKADAKAYLYAKLTIARGTPVLPGAVALFRDTT